MRDPIGEIIELFDVVILDGGLATELEARGAVLDDPLWSSKILLDDPELIAAVHRDYLAAGADIITTASYQATIAGLSGHGRGLEFARDVLRSSVALACRERDGFWSTRPADAPPRPRPLVAASIGSLGAFLTGGREFRGDYNLSRAELKEHHRPQLEVLANAGADVMAFETIPRVDEAVAFAELLSEIPGTPAWISFVCRDDRSIASGETIAAACVALERFPQVVALGVNCTAPHLVGTAVARAHAASSKPILVYPNSGESWKDGGWHGARDEGDLASHAREWIAAGASGIGGCCRTTPDHIAALARTLRPG